MSRPQSLESDGRLPCPGARTLPAPPCCNAQNLFCDAAWAGIRDKLGLSARQASIARYVVADRSDAAIAKTLGVSWSTVQTHMDRLHKKLDVHSTRKGDRSILSSMARTLRLICVVLVSVSPLLAEEPMLLTTLTGHSSGVNCVAWSPDGKTLASGSYDETARLWITTGGNGITVLRPRPIDYEMSYITSVAWSPDGKVLAAAGGRKTVSLWGISSGMNVTTLEGQRDHVDSVAWSPNGKTLAMVGDGAIELLDVATGKNVLTLNGRVDCAAWSPDGRYIASGGAGGVVKVRDVPNGKTMVSFDADGWSVLAVAYSKNGRILASASGCLVELWDISNHTRIRSLKGHSCELVTYLHELSGGQYIGGQYIPSVRALDFSPDGKTLASGSQDKTVLLWDLTSGKKIATLGGHSGGVKSVAFSPNGRTLASGSDDKTIKLWAVPAWGRKKGQD